MLFIMVSVESQMEKQTDEDIKKKEILGVRSLSRMVRSCEQCCYWINQQIKSTFYLKGCIISIINVESSHTRDVSGHTSCVNPCL